jgi:hypothetical protein
MRQQPSLLKWQKVLKRVKVASIVHKELLYMHCHQMQDFLAQTVHFGFGQTGFLGQFCQSGDKPFTCW